MITTTTRLTSHRVIYPGAVLGQLTIRDAEPDDAKKLGAAHVIAADEAYGHYFPAEFMQRNTVERRTQMWSHTLAQPQHNSTKPRVVVAEEQHQILGFGAFGPARDDDAPAAYELWRLYVLSPAYGTGLATRLLQTLDPHRPASYLWVMEANHRAIGFYRKHGYRPDGVVEHLKLMNNLPKIRMTRSAQSAD